MWNCQIAKHLFMVLDLSKKCFVTLHQENSLKFSICMLHYNKTWQTKTEQLWFDETSHVCTMLKHSANRVTECVICISQADVVERKLTGVSSVSGCAGAIPTGGTLRRRPCTGQVRDCNAKKYTWPSERFRYSPLHALRKLINSYKRYGG